MKIAITADENHLASPIALHFEQSNYYIIVDLRETVLMHYKIVQNPGTLNDDGILAAQMLINFGVEVLVTGWCELNALRILQKAKIVIYKFSTGTVQKVIKVFQGNRYTLNQLRTDTEKKSSK